MKLCILKNLKKGPMSLQELKAKASQLLERPVTGRRMGAEKKRFQAPLPVIRLDSNLKMGAMSGSKL